MRDAKTRAGFGTLLTVGAIALEPSTATAADVAERPAWKVGDKWVFRAVENPGAKESKWSREVVAQLPGGHFEIVLNNGNRVEFDEEANSLDNRGAEYSWRRFKFPLSVGVAWTHERKIRGGDEKSSWQVRAFEKITVPAGTYDCFKVEGEAFRDFSGVATSGPKTVWRGYTKTTYWYCPAVKWAAKWETEDVAFVSAPRVITVSELTSFRKAP